MNKLKYLVALAVLALGTTVVAADKGPEPNSSTSDKALVKALVKKGVLTEEEAEDILVKEKKERREVITAIADLERTNKEKEDNKLPIKFTGKIRTFLEHDDINTPDEQPGMKLSNWISKVGIQFQQPITTVKDMDGWVINGRYETSFQSDNPKSSGTMIGDNWSTIGLASSKTNEKYRIDFGRRAHNIWYNMLEFGIFSDDPGSPLGEIHARQGIFMSNGLFAQYRPFKGMKLNLDYSLSEKDKKSNPYTVSARYDWSNYSIVATRYENSETGNRSNMLAGSIKMPQLKSKLTGMISDDIQRSSTGDPWPVEGLKTRGYSAQWKWNNVPDNTIIFGGGYRSDGVRVLALGDDYKLRENLTLQIHYQRVRADDPIVFTTANDIGPLFGKNGGGPGGTATSRDHLAVGLMYTW